MAPGPRAFWASVGLPLFVAIFVTIALVLTGVELPFALAWAVLLSTIVIARRASSLSSEPGWPPAHKQVVVVRGSEVSRLAWSFAGRNGVAGPTIVRRVRNLVRRRLAHRGIDVDDPAQFAQADAILGDGVRAGLFHHQIMRADIERALDAIERLPRTTRSAEPSLPAHPNADASTTPDHPAKEDR